MDTSGNVPHQNIQIKNWPNQPSDCYTGPDRCISAFRCLAEGMNSGKEICPPVVYKKGFLMFIINIAEVLVKTCVPLSTVSYFMKHCHISTKSYVLHYWIAGSQILTVTKKNQITSTIKNLLTNNCQCQLIGQLLGCFSLNQTILPSIV